MHIVYVSREYPPSYRGGGIASYLKIMAEGFASKGYKVTVIAANDDTRAESDDEVNGVRVIRLSGGDFCLKESEPSTGILDKFRFIYRFHSYRKKIRDVILSLHNVDVVEVAEYGAEGLYLNDLKIPVVYRLHTPALLDHKRFSLQKPNLSNFIYYYGGKKELDILKHQAEYITSCSTSLKEWVGKYAGVDTKKIKVIYNPLQPDFLKSDSPIDSSGHNNTTVFFAGTICDWKGAGDLVEACKIINEKGVEVTLKMAGKIGVFGETLKKENETATWLKILGKLPQQDLKDLYANSAVVCFPSWWENMPMVCIEAMAQGAIVIGSNSGGMSEIIEDGKSGFLLPPLNPEKWADKIKEVLELPNEIRERVSLAAKKRINDVFGLDNILCRTSEYYNSVIKDFNK